MNVALHVRSRLQMLINNNCF